MDKRNTTAEVIERITYINALLKTASGNVDEAAVIVKDLIKSGVKAATIVEHSGFLTLRDIKSLIDIADNKLSAKLWLIGCPGSSILRKAPLKVQEHIIDYGAPIWNPQSQKIQTIPVAKLTKFYTNQLLDNKGNIRTITQQRRFLSTWQPPAKKPVYQVVDNNTVRFNRACTLTKPELRKLLRA